MRVIERDDTETAGRQAFAAVYAEQLSGIYSYFLAQSGIRQDAEDLCQQVFTRALAAYPRYRAGELPISVWLFRIARNLLIDTHRQRRSTVSWDLVPEPDHPVAPDDVETQVLRREAVGRLGPLLARLAPEKREILVLRFGSGLKIPEIAALLERTESAVRSDLHRIIQSLKEAYHDD